MQGGGYGGYGNGVEDDLYLRMRQQMAENGIDPNFGVKRPDYFYFSGNAMSLQSRLETLTD